MWISKNGHVFLHVSACSEFQSFKMPNIFMVTCMYNLENIQRDFEKQLYLTSLKLCNYDIYIK